MSSSTHYTSELPAAYPPLSSISPPPTIHSPQPISIASQPQQPYAPYTYPSGPSDYYAPPAQDSLPTQTSYQGYTPVPVQQSPAAVAPVVQPSYDAEKGGAGVGGKKMITIFGKKYTKKTVIIASIVLAVVLIFIIGLGAGLGAKNSRKKKSTGKSRTGGSGGFDLDGGDGGDEDTSSGNWDSTTDDSSSGGDDSGSSDSECNSCSCYTDLALLEKCVQNEHDMTMDILNNWKQ